MISDFNQNAGPSAVEAARRLGVGVFTVGVGPLVATDIAVDLAAPPVMKRREVGAHGHRPPGGRRRADGPRPLHRAAAGRQRQALPRGGDRHAEPEARRGLAERGAALRAQAGGAVPLGRRGRSSAGGDSRGEQPGAAPGDGPGRLLAAVVRRKYEPTWEWRFIKEVFHRDPLVGIKGFRTFLRSADPAVRQTERVVPAHADAAAERVLRQRRDLPGRHARLGPESALLPHDQGVRGASSAAGWWSSAVRGSVPASWPRPRWASCCR